MSAPTPMAWKNQPKIGKKTRKRLKKLRKAAKKAAFKGPKVQVLAWGKGKSLLKGPKEKIYTAPVAKQRVINASKPRFNGGRGATVVVKHREWLQQILSVQTFTGAGRYIIQPGLTDNFPWLGQIAANFENYKIRKCRYIYRNRISTSASFVIYLGVQYDVNDAEFKSIEEIMNYEGSREEVCWRDFTYDVKPRKGQLTKQYMVRTDNLPSGTDPVPYDTALFTICGVGSNTAGTYLGDLLVEYEVELRNPKMNPNLVAAAGAYTFGSFTSMGQVSSDPFNGMSLPASNPAQGDYKGFSDDNRPTITGGAVPTITFPVPGAYKVEYAIDDPEGTGTITGSNFTVSSGTGSILSSFQNFAGVAGKGIRQFCDIITTSPAAQIAMGALTTSGTAGGPFGSTLLITCESLNYMLDRFNQAPNPPLDPVFITSLKRAFPKHDHSRWDKLLERKQYDEHLKDIVAGVRREVKRSIIHDGGDMEQKYRKMEVQHEEAENSDGDVVIQLQPRSRSIDRRSKSSEPRDDRGKEPR